MKIRSLSFALLFLTFFVAPLHATKYYGVGLESCGAWTEAKEEGWGNVSYPQYVGWVTGYVTGFTVSTGDRYKDTDVPALLVYIDNYCQKNPLKPFMDGARLLVHDLSISSAMDE